MKPSASDPHSDLEAVFEQMLKRVRGVPLRVIVRALADCEVIPIDPAEPADAKLLADLDIAIRDAAHAVRLNPIVRPRPNEVGNDIEAFVKAALVTRGFRVTPPAARNGLTKGVGYPDILIFDSEERPTYIECKTYSAKTATSSMRSFYLSPSESFKVCYDARHLVLSFEMYEEEITGTTPKVSAYTPLAFKLVDATELLCDVKYEFNSDNRRLYDERLILLAGKL